MSSNSSTQQFDFIVIGCGSGGSACADRALAYGAKVCLIERGFAYVDGVRQGAGHGGTCVNVGCVPKKLMFEAAHVIERIRGHSSTADGFGISVRDVSFEWARLKQARDAHTREINEAFQAWGSAREPVPNFTHVTGFARFIDCKTVEVLSSPPSLSQAPQQTLLASAPHILIATGGYPTPCSLPGGELTISSDGFFDLETQPTRVGVVGAGYVAVEMAGILHAFGTETSLFFRGDTVLRYGYDKFVVERLMDELARHGPHLFPRSEPTSLHKTSDGIMMTLADGSTHGPFDQVLWAVGRTPATANLNLPAAAVMCVASGHIPVDEFENTNVPGVYAIGDVAEGGWELTPVAIAAGRRLADRLFGGVPGCRIFYETIPTVVFSHPPIGMVGLTEEAAVKKFGKDNVEVKENTFGCLQYAFNPQERKVMSGLKLVLVGKQQRVAGLHIIGPCADEIVQGFAVAVRMGATLQDFEATVAIHPTIGEEFVTFSGWFQHADGKPREHMPVPKELALE